MIAVIFKQFLLLGCTSFGGPAAHIAYFRKQFVERDAWLSESHFAQLVALSQVLPGPGSSQLGFAIGHHKGGLAGAMAAFIGFTLPSFLLMLLLLVLSYMPALNTGLYALIIGLKLLAIVVIADAINSMFASFCKASSGKVICVLTALFVFFVSGIWTQLLVLGVAAFYGAYFLPNSVSNMASHKSVRFTPLVLFFVFFIISLLPLTWPLLSLFGDFYQAGSLVFGGGHVVLPLLQESVGEAVSRDQFLLAYAAAQAVPGPMFTLATYLGGQMLPQQLLIGASVATIAVFLPGFLLVLSLNGAWQKYMCQPKVAGAVAGINAAVVGLLLAALWRLLMVQFQVSAFSLIFAFIGFMLLLRFKPPILLMVAAYSLLGFILSVYL